MNHNVFTSTISILDQKKSVKSGFSFFPLRNDVLHMKCSDITHSRIDPQVCFISFGSEKEGRLKPLRHEDSLASRSAISEASSSLREARKTEMRELPVPRRSRPSVSESSDTERQSCGRLCVSYTEQEDTF